MASEATVLKPVEAGVLDLWERAQEEFHTKTNASEAQILSMKVAPRPHEWLSSFKKSRHPDGKWRKAYEAVSRHLKILEVAVQVLAYGIGIASDVASVVAPASYIVNAFSWVLASFTDVSDNFDKIEKFFGLMAKKFDDLHIIKTALQQKGKEVLRQRVVDLFACSLEICAVAIKAPKKRIRSWIASLCGDSELDGLIQTFDTRDNFLRQAVSLETYADVAVIRADVASLDAMLLEELRNIKDNLQRRPSNDNEWKEILDWLSPLDYLGKYNELIDRVHDRPSAGQWLLESEPFLCWQDGDNDKLWYRGEPGAGKSILATIVIRHLLDKTNVSSDGPGKQAAVAYMYHSYENNLDIKMLLGSVASQVLSRYAGLAALPEEAKSVLQRYRDRRSFGPPEKFALPNRGELEQILCAIACDRRLYIVVDAMDECTLGTRQELMRSLRKISNLKIMITSRLIENESDMAKGFQCHSIMANATDIDGYVESIVRYNSVLKGHELRIKQQVKKSSVGIFLLARLHMAALEGIALDSEIEAALQDLPVDPEECYSKAVHRMKQSTKPKQKVAFEALAWAAFAVRPLIEDELRHALSFNKHADKLDITTGVCASMADISAYCCGLVVADMQKNVRFVHYSAKEYFRSHREMLFDASFHLVAAWTCAKYLCSIQIESHTDGHSSGLSDSFDYILAKKKRKERILLSNLEHFPFAAYAGENLHKHYEEIRDQPKEFVTSFPNFSIPAGSLELASTQTSITHAAVIHLMGFLAEDSNRRGFFLDVLERRDAYYEYHQLDVSEDSFGLGRGDSAYCSPLHVAAFLGCSTLVERQLEKGLDVNEVDSHGQSALMIAFKKHFGDIAAILLKQGASVDLSTARGHALLLYAAQMNNDDAAKAIISRNAGPKEELIGSLFKLMFSPVIVLLYLLGMLVGNLELISLSNKIPALLSVTENVEKGVEDITLEFKLYCEVLLAAYSGDSKATAQHLLALGTDDDPLSEEPAHLGTITPSDTDSDSFSESDRSESHPVRQNLQSRRMFLKTACFLAVEGAHIQVIEVLLRHGAHVDLEDAQGQSLLHRATARNKIDLVQFLLDKNANFRAEDGKGRTALIANADTQRKEVLELLINNGAMIQAFSDISNGVHEIYRAAALGKTEMVKFFLQHGVDASFSSSSYCSKIAGPSRFRSHGFMPLHAAAANGHDECVQLLLEHGANPSSISDRGDTPLDFVKNRETLYPMRDLGLSLKEWEAYSRQHKYRQDMEQRYERIEALLTAKGAKTSKELYQAGFHKR